MNDLNAADAKKRLSATFAALGLHRSWFASTRGAQILAGELKMLSTLVAMAFFAAAMELPQSQQSGPPPSSEEAPPPADEATDQSGAEPANGSGTEETAEEEEVEQGFCVLK